MASGIARPLSDNSISVKGATAWADGALAAGFEDEAVVALYTMDATDSYNAPR